ncbi:MAG: adenylate/guanylate [Gallionellaceae bacterium]|nr:MAG: adenylate/guanylate [Gallionellaceae bacterium]
MEERGNKTIICSVFFLDIVEYSKKSVSGQISLKERFNAFLSTAIRDVPSDDRIILDTGDGAAISFLGDVEDALRAALSMRASLLSEEGLIDPPLLVRMGINLGPVRLVKDINGQPNIVGDGINVAQRVMGFAEPGQILVSRSYYDAASRLSQEYAGMFHFEGSRTDKHVREHEVYAIGHPGDLTPSQQAADPKEETKLAKALVNVRVKSKIHWDALVVRYHELSAHIREKFIHASGQQKTLYVGVAAIPLLLLLLLVVKLSHKPEAPLKDLPKVAEVNSPLPVDAAKSGVSLASSAPVAATSSAKRTSPAHEKKLSSQQKKASKMPHPAKEKTPGSAAQGTVTLTIKPWGEVYLNGKWVDVSPPLTKLQVPAGTHIVEIRNTTFPAYKQSINIKAGEKINIHHKFSN